MVCMRHHGRMDKRLDEKGVRSPVRRCAGGLACSHHASGGALLRWIRSPPDAAAAIVRMAAFPVLQPESASDTARSGGGAVIERKRQGAQSSG